MTAARNPRITRSNRRGSNAIEFALVLPILITLIAAIMEYSWFFSELAAVGSAARYGARAGVVNLTPANVEAAAEAEVTTRLNATGFDFSGATPAGTVYTDAFTNEVYLDMTVVAPYDPIVNFPAISPPATIEANAIMRLETQP